MGMPFTQETDRLFRAILELKTVEECSAFFEDLCTVNELLSMTQRYEVARMLKKGMTFAQISKASGASTATISRVNKSLLYGEGGYRMAIERTNEEEEND